MKPIQFRSLRASSVCPCALATILLLTAMARAAETPAKDSAASPSVQQPTIEEVLKAISVGPYELPPLPLRTNQNYANSPSDVEPYSGVKPFKEHFLVQMQYTGAGRSIPEPEHVDTVKIGFLGPIMPTVSVATGGKSHEEALGIDMLRGARLAIEHANERGGYSKRKIPFELVVRNDNGLWGASGTEIAKLAYADNVWAILGSIDSANTHIAIRVALKIEIPMLTSGDTDPTYIETNIPWVLRCIGDDRQMNYLITDYLFRKMKYTRVAIIRASNRYGRFGVREIRDSSRRLGHPVLIEMAYKVGATDFSVQLDRVAEAKPEVIVHWGDAEDTGNVLNALRARGMKQPVIASDRAVSDEFLKIAGPNAEGIVCGFPWNPTRQDPKLETFREAYRKRFGAEAETYAAHAYDGMNMFIWAIQTAGLNRAKIRDVLAHRPDPFPGVTGDIPLSAVLDDDGEVFLAIREGGQWRYRSRADLGIPRGPVIQKMRVDREQAKVK